MLKDLWQKLPRETFHRNNALSVFFMAALPAVAGSAISFLLSAFTVWGVVSLLLKRFPFSLTREDRILAMAFTTVPVAIVLTALIGDNPQAGLHKSVAFIPFLAPWVLVPRLRASPSLDYLVIYAAGAAVGAIAGAIPGAYQTIVLAMRAEGGAGNSAVFAIIMLALAAVASVNIGHARKSLRSLALAGSVVGVVSSAATLTRGVWLATVPTMLVMFSYGPRQWFRALTVVNVLLIAAFCVGVVYLLEFQIQSRAGEMLNMLGFFDSLVSLPAAIGQRLGMWEAGMEAVKQSPLLGYGIQNRMAVLAQYYPEGIGGLPYTHSHNGFLTFAIDGGVLGVLSVVCLLAAPIVIAWRAASGGQWLSRFYVALLVSGIYTLCGMSQIMFNHDIMDSFFIFNAIVVAASIGKARIAESETAIPQSTA